MSGREQPEPSALNQGIAALHFAEAGHLESRTHVVAHAAKPHSASRERILDKVVRTSRWPGGRSGTSGKWESSVDTQRAVIFRPAASGVPRVACMRAYSTWPRFVASAPARVSGGGRLAGFSFAAATAA